MRSDRPLQEVQMADAPPKKRLLPPIYLLFWLIAMTALRLLAPGPRIIPRTLEVWGAAPIILGICMVLYCARCFRERGTTIKPFQESEVLITNRLYAFTRNPIYLGMTLIGLGAAVMLGHLAPMLLIPVFPILINSAFIPAEEAMLEARFGEAWQRYRNRVRRWL